MADEIIVTPSSITEGSSADIFNQQIELPDDVAERLGFKTNAEPTKTEPAATETKVEPTDVAKAEPQSAPTDGTVKPEVKPDKVPYTESELKSLLADPQRPGKSP